MRVSLHICTRERPAEVYGLLVSIFNQPFNNYDIVIIDESDQPIRNQKYINDMLTRLKFDGHGIIYVHNTIRNGISAARNLAVEKDLFKNEYIIRIDDDSIVATDYIQRLVNVIEKDKEGVIGAVGGLVPTFGIEQWRRLPHNTDLFEKIEFKENGIFVSDNGGTLWDPQHILPSEHLRSSYLFRRSAWEKVKGFDESQGGFTGWREETVFCMDLAWAGYGIVIDLGALCHHVRTFRGGGSGLVADPNYQQTQALNELHFQNRNIKKFLRNGTPFTEEWFKKCRSVM